jgi:hypothetical protein
MLKTRMNLRGLTTAALCAVILAALCVPAFAQESEDELRDKRLNIALQLRANAFQLTNYMFARTDIRNSSYQDYTLIQWPLNSIEYYTDDTYVDVSYNASNYGGSVRLNKSVLSSGVFGLKGWVQFGVMRVSVGNVIGSTYADVLGSDQKLRIYTGKTKSDSVGWTEYKTPDNITGDEGVLIEALLNPFTFAVAGGNFESTMDWYGPVNNTNTFARREGIDIRYGARVGYEMGTLGRLNASYIVEGKKIRDGYGFKRDSTDLVARMANAEYYDHQFGLFGSLRLTENAELTVGYVGALTAYLSEFYSSSQNTMVETGYPLVFRNGLNLNARIKANRFTLRTDNCLTLWEDQNYNLFETGNTQGWKDVGLEPKSTAGNYAAISHFVMWNGFGLSYPLMEKVSLTSYLRNLFSMYTAEGNGPTARGEYTFIRDEVTFDFGVSLAYNANIEAFVKLGVGYKMTYRSKDLNSQTPSAFISYINNNASNGKPEPVETLDHALSLSIPIGISVKY